MNKKESKHTPGPWGHVYHRGLGELLVGATLENVAIVETRHGQERGEANARLIAQAPKMLSALEDGIQAIDAFGGTLPEGYGLPKILVEWAEWAEDITKDAKGE